MKIWLGWDMNPNEKKHGLGYKPEYEDAWLGIFGIIKNCQGWDINPTEN